MSGKPGAAKIARTISETRAAIAGARAAGNRIGLIPTMGYLHEGHLSLIDTCKKHADYVAVSIFVNPTQFGPKEDFQKYPRNFEQDRQLVASRGTDLIFAPDVHEMYPEKSLIRFEIDRLGDHLCGARRPRHFAGVLQVVTKLFHIVQPDVAIFGQKDLQQLTIIKRLVTELDFPLEIISGPTLRDPDGLAMSSRNSYLSREERQQAGVLYRAMQLAKKQIEAGERNSQLVIQQMTSLIQTHVPGAKIDYIEIVNLDELQPITECSGRFAITLAVYIGKTRLIDNLVLELQGNNVKEIKALA